MESEQPDDMPFALSDDQDSSADDESQRKQTRKAQNRGYSRKLRQKKKAKVQLLESREAELTEEVNKLRALAAQATSFYPDDGLHDSTDHFHQKIAASLSSPEATDREFNALIDELHRHVGVSSELRIGKLANTFQNTLNLILPKYVKFSLWISGSEASRDQCEFPNWKDFFKSASLTPAQSAAFEEHQQSFERESRGLKETFDQFKQMSVKILWHARVLHSLIQELRQILKPRQVATCILWVPKYYSFLAAEKVLNYGDNSADFLNPA